LVHGGSRDGVSVVLWDLGVFGGFEGDFAGIKVAFSVSGGVFVVGFEFNSVLNGVVERGG